MEAWNSLIAKVAQLTDNFEIIISGDALTVSGSLWPIASSEF